MLSITKRIRYTHVNADLSIAKAALSFHVCDDVESTKIYLQILNNVDSHSSCRTPSSASSLQPYPVRKKCSHACLLYAMQ